jgi:hypothetical protein
MTSLSSSLAAAAATSLTLERVIVEDGDSNGPEPQDNSDVYLYLRLSNGQQLYLIYNVISVVIQYLVTEKLMLFINKLHY